MVSEPWPNVSNGPPVSRTERVVEVCRATRFAPRQVHDLVPRGRDALEAGRRPVPWIVGEVDAGADLRPAREVLVEPGDRLGEIGRLLGRRVLGGRMADVAEVQALRPGEELVRGDRLVGVEKEVVSALEQQRRNGE